MNAFRQPRLSEQARRKADNIPWHQIRGVLFDWAGTTIDHGSLAPVQVVIAVFREFNIEVTEAEARHRWVKPRSITCAK